MVFWIKIKLINFEYKKKNISIGSDNESLKNDYGEKDDDDNDDDDDDDEEERWEKEQIRKGVQLFQVGKHHIKRNYPLTINFKFMFFIILSSNFNFFRSKVNM